MFKQNRITRKMIPWIQKSITKSLLCTKIFKMLRTTGIQCKICSYAIELIKKNVFLFFIQKLRQKLRECKNPSTDIIPTIKSMYSTMDISTDEEMFHTSSKYLRTIIVLTVESPSCLTLKN